MNYISDKSIVGRQIRKIINMPIIEASSSNEELFDYFRDQLKCDGSSFSKGRVENAKKNLNNDHLLISILS